MKTPPQPFPMLALALPLASATLSAGAVAKTKADDKTATKVASKLYWDVHEFGPGKVTAEAVAAAHAKDVATEGKFGVHYHAYWFDEKAGKVYCLAESPSAEAAVQVHKEAHGLIPSRIVEVTADNKDWRPKPGLRLFLDVHRIGPGKVGPAELAAVHQKDVAVQAKHGVRYLNYWFDAETGTVMCLSEAPSAEAALAVHREAHGLMPSAIDEVVEGR